MNSQPLRIWPDGSFWFCDPIARQPIGNTDSAAHIIQSSTISPGPSFRLDQTEDCGQCYEAVHENSALPPAASLFFISFLSLAFSQTIANSSLSFPLAFEVNRGQTAAQVNYLARSREGTIFLTKDGATFAVTAQGVFRLRLEGASTRSGSFPEQLLRSRSSYLSDRRQIGGIENYGAVRYRGVYPGTDVLFYGRDQHLEHDFLRAAQIRTRSLWP